MLSIFSGLALTITGTRPVSIVDDDFSNLFWNGSFLGVQAPIWWTIVLTAAGYYLLHQMPYGRRVYATGGNAVAARFSGVRTDGVKIFAFVLCGMLLGAAVFYTGNSRPNGEVPWLATQAATGRTFGIPNAFLVWLVVAAITVWVLKRTVYGNYLYALGNSRRAVFLAGARVRLVMVATFVLAGVFSSFGAILLLGYTNQAYQGMGDPYLMTISAR